MLEDLSRSFVSLQGSLSTRKVYRSDLKDLGGFLSHRGRALTEASIADAADWRRSLEERGLAPATIARKLAIARSFYEFIVETELDGDPTRPRRNPFAKVKPPPFDRSAGKTPCPTLLEVKQLLAAIDKRTSRGIRDRAIMLLLFNQGLRVSEVARLKKSHIRKSGSYTMIVLPGKGGSHVETVLGPAVVSALDRHLQRNPANGDFVFHGMPRNPGYHRGNGYDVKARPITSRSVHANLKKYASKAGLDPCLIRPHSGRVFFITHGYLKTRDLERVARAVGHRCLATTRRYLRYHEPAGSHPALLLDLDSQRTDGGVTSGGK